MTNLAEEGAHSQSISDRLRQAGVLAATTPSAFAAKDELLAALLAASGDCIEIFDLADQRQFISEGLKRAGDAAAAKMATRPDIWAGMANHAAREAIGSAKAGKTANFVCSSVAGGDSSWMVQASPILGPDGSPTHVLLIWRDTSDLRLADATIARLIEEAKAAAVTEAENLRRLLQEELIRRKEAEARQQILSGELQHRIKNTLAMVSAIATQTLYGEDIAERRNSFNDRLIALSHAHDILMATSWASASIESILVGVLTPHRSEEQRISISGPEVLLQPRQALSLSLTIHELATNAAKYGSLSNKLGQVSISWETDGLDDEGEQIFRFTWRETGGPAVAVPTRKGFGSRLITRVLAADFDGTVTIEYPVTGVVCTLLAPIGSIEHSTATQAAAGTTHG
ncbi:MAG TPA: sensor histidine kinase [Arsenicitalea sp.]|jgi:two-component sensor histidine kinase|nr:sensor histidine kinase [Arsenicitalea sp.]